MATVSLVEPSPTAPYALTLATPVGVPEVGISKVSYSITSRHSIET